MNDLYTPVTLCIVITDSRATVGAAVIDQIEFPVLKRLGKNRIKKLRQIRLYLIHGGDNTHLFFHVYI